MADQKNQVAVIYGGRSVEHEISVITALQLMKAIDSELYHVIPVYIAPDGRWFTGDALFDRTMYRKVPGSLVGLTQVTQLPIPSSRGLSIMSNGALCTAAESLIPVDVYIPAFHGEFGEDGCIQGILEMAEVAYASSGVLGSAVAMDKYICKAILKAHDIPVLPGALARKCEAKADLNALCDRLISDESLGGFPLFVKPCHLGSSVGISKATDVASLQGGLAKVFRYDNEALVEPFLADMFEVNVAAMDHEPLILSAVEIPVSDSGLLSYEEKYMRGGTKESQSEGMASLTRIVDPPDLDPKIKQTIYERAEKAFRILNCSGVGRFDFMVDKQSGEIYFNELNPIPGSLSFYLWIESTPKRLYTNVLTNMIERAKEVRSEKAALERSIGFKALKD